MIIAALILSISALLAALVWWFAIRAGQVVATMEDWEHKKYEVNMQVLALLLDRNEEGYLRRFLTIDQFRKVQRKRIRIAIDCVVRIGRNAGMLVQLAEHVGAGANEQRAHAARDLANLAMHVRLSSFVVVWCLRLKWAIPFAGIPFSAQPLRYRELIDALVVVVRGQSMPNPSHLQFTSRSR